MNDDTTPVNDASLHEFEKLVVSQIVRTKKSGVKLYFSNTALLDAKFRATVRDNNLVVEQVGPGEPGHLVRLDSHQNNAMVTFYTMYGDRFVKDVHILPTVTNGLFTWVVTDIPDLKDNRQRRMSYRALRPLRSVPPASFTRTAEPPAQPEPEPEPEPEVKPVHHQWRPFLPPRPTDPGLNKWSVGAIRTVLGYVREIEAETGYRLMHNEQGQAIFSTPPIEL